MKTAKGHRLGSAGAAAILLLTPVGGCEVPGTGVVQERSDSAGVQVVRVAEPAHVLPWDFQERWRVGGAEEGATAFSRLSRWTVAPTPDRTLSILDPLNHRVVVLDSAGVVRRTYGGRGDGPGELQGPAGLALGPDSAVWVYDQRKRQLIRFAADGAPLEPRRVESRVWEPARPGTDGVYVGERSVIGSDSMRRGVLRISMDEETPVITVSLPRPAMVEVPGCGASVPMGRLFERDLTWDAQGNRVAVFLGPEYVVDIYDDGRHTLSLRMPTPPRPVTEALAARQYGDGFRLGLPGGDCVVDPVKMARARGFAPHLPAVADVRVTPDGEIWVQRGHVAGEAAVIDIWAADGEYVGALPAGTPLPLAFLPGGAVGISEVDDWDVPRLVVLDVIRTSDTRASSDHTRSVGKIEAVVGRPVEES